MEEKKVRIEKLWVTKKFLEGATQFFQTDSNTETIEKLLEWFDYYQSIIPFKGCGKGKGFENTVFQ